jgi:N-acetyl-anhydromuramyl-L-alanine amidase AmpD
MTLFAPLLSTIAIIGQAAPASSGKVAPPSPASIAEPEPVKGKGKTGEEIVVCGERFRIGAPVVLWSDPGGYDAYKLDPPLPEPKLPTKGADRKPRDPRRQRYDVRTQGLTAEQLAEIRARDFTLPALRQVVDQFVLHYDVCGTSKQCFRVLHDLRGLSVHFMLDLDGTIYQTLDLKERAWHATIANHRSIGIEIAHIGAYPPADPPAKMELWYKPDPAGKLFIDVPKGIAPAAWRVPGFVPRPRSERPVTGVIQGTTLRQYDFTPQQYESLIALTAGLCRVFPEIRCDYPRDADGKLIPRKLGDGEFIRYKGVLGHYHVQLNKTDPGPALDWDHLINSARGKLGVKR